MRWHTSSTIALILWICCHRSTALPFRCSHIIIGQPVNLVQLSCNLPSRVSHLRGVDDARNGLSSWCGCADHIKVSWAPGGGGDGCHGKDADAVWQA